MSRWGSLEERFWSRVNKAGPTVRADLGPCWDWRGTMGSGYGQIGTNKVTVYAHRLSWEWANGQPALDKVVCHKCDRPSCVNPAHLFVGSHLDNVRDMVSKGRQARGATSGSVLHPGSLRRGTAHHRSRLTEDDVWTILYLHAMGTRVGDIANRFSIAQGQISDIVNGKAWRHVGEVAA